MTASTDENDLRNYFRLYKDYQEAEDQGLINELDSILSQYKDRFHEDSEAVLKLLLEKQPDFIEQYEDSYNDLVFDLEVHAKSVKEIRHTHTYDPEEQMWVPKRR